MIPQNEVYFLFTNANPNACEERSSRQTRTRSRIAREANSIVSTSVNQLIFAFEKLRYS